MTKTDGWVYGLDLSTQRVAVAAVCPSDGRSWVQEVFIPQDTPNRPMAAQQAMRPVLMEWEPGIAFIEDPVMGISAKSTIEQAFVSGVIQAQLSLRDFTIEMVNNSAWKKTVVGSGNAKKDAVAVYVEQHLPEWAALVHEAEPRSKQRRQDLFDAVCILMYGVTERLRHL